MKKIIKKITFIFLSLLIFLPPIYGKNLYSQDSSEKKNAIVLAPLNMFNVNYPAIFLGYERFIKQKWSLQVEGAYIMNHSIEHFIADKINRVSHCPYTNKGFLVNTGVKYYIFKRANINMYVSGELFYAQNESNLLRNFVILNTEYQYKDFFYNFEQEIGLNGKFGIKLFFGNFFYLEPHVGCGISYRIVKQEGRERPQDQLESEYILIDNASTSKIGINLPVNIKIGFKF